MMETDNICVPSRTAQRNLLLISWCCAISGSFVGYAAASINGAISFIARDMHLESAGIGLMSSCFEIGAGAGSILSGLSGDKFGRKHTLLSAELCYIVAISATALASNFTLLILSRILLGFASGAINVIAPVLLAEFCTPETRARKLTASQLMNTSGEAIVFIVGASLGWRWIYWLAVAPAILLLILHAKIVPKSPRWLARMGRGDESLKILQKIRCTNAEIGTEMREIDLVLNGGQQQMSSSSTAESSTNVAEAVPSTTTNNLFSRLRSPCARRVLLLGVGIAMVQQGTGVGIGMKFGTFMLAEAGFSQQDALKLNIVIGMVAVIAVSGGLWLVTQMSLRRMMMVAQVAIICVHLAIAAVSASLPQQSLTRGWLLLGLLLVFMTFVQGTCSPVANLLMNEIFPLDMRGFGKGVATLATYGTALVLDQMFPISLKLIGQSPTFALFALIGIFALFFTWRCLPETHGKSLEELEQQFKAADCWKEVKRRSRKTQQKNRRKGSAEK